MLPGPIQGNLIVSLKNTIESALERKTTPIQDGRPRKLADALRTSSVRKLISDLDNLPPAAVIYSSAALNAKHVDGSAQIFLQSDGLASFAGDVHENGVLGGHYVFAMVFLDVKDAAGNILAFATSGSLAGSANPFGLLGSDHDQWQIDGFNQLLIDHWDVIRNGNARVVSTLSVSDSPIDIVKFVLAWLGAGLLVAGGIGLVIFLAQGGVTCPSRPQVQLTSGPNGGIGMDVVMR